MSTAPAQAQPQTPAVRQNGNAGREVARKDPRVTTIYGLLEKMAPEIQRALPKHMDVKRMTRLAFTAIRTTPALLACTPESLLAAVMNAAEVGLEINGILGHAYLVPYGTEAKLLCGYKGLLILARRSKQIETIEGHAVYEADDFDYEYGSRAFLHHRPTADRKRGEVVGAWAMTRFKGASHPQFDFLNREDIEARRKRSKQSGKGPWVTDYAAMCVKTAYRQHAKIWPLSPVERGLIETEDLIDAGVELPAAPDMSDIPSLEGPPTRSSQIADALEAKAAPADDADDDLPDDPEWDRNRE
jgi:recombination protein RecT